MDAKDLSQYAVTVCFIDYGNVEEVALQDLVIISKEGLTSLGGSVMSLIKVPALAMECSLVNTKPNSVRTDNEAWDDESIKAFEELLLKNDNGERKVLGEVYSVTPGNWAPFITITLYKDAEDHAKVYTIYLLKPCCSSKETIFEYFPGTEHK